MPFAKLITLILSLKGSSITCELMEHFGYTKTLVSEPAFVKRRGRLLPEALETIFRLFVENIRPSNRYKGFQLPAVDGSDLHTPTILTIPHRLSLGLADRNPTTCNT